MNNFFRKSIFLALVALLGAGCFLPRGSAAAAQQKTFWQYQCVDTMKYSRDAAREMASNPKGLQTLVRAQLSAAKNMGANCVAIATPYDSEFTPVLKVWVDQARWLGLTVWFRGNMSGWEGWFNYPKLQNTAQHHAGIAALVTTHPELFEERDIFTPAPEAENGMLGSPFQSPQKAEALRTFLEESYANCVAAFAKIKKNVRCGFFSANGDVAEKIFTKEMVQKTGGVVVVDHYVKTGKELVEDLENLHNKFDAPVFLGEFGGPIPDIHGALSESKQAQLIEDMLGKLYEKRSFIIGVNYWVLSGGTTALLTDDNKPKEAAAVVKKYFTPAMARGKIYSDSGEQIQKAVVSALGQQVLTDSEGQYEIPILSGTKTELKAGADGFRDSSSKVEAANPGQEVEHNFTLEPVSRGWWQRVGRFFKKIFT